MPMIDLTLPAGALQPSALTTLVEDLTTIVLRWEGVADNPATRAMAWAFVHELPQRGRQRRRQARRTAHLPGLSDRAAGLAGHYRPTQRAPPQRTGA